MEFTVTINHGPLDVEVVGEERKKIQEEILGLAEFIEQHEDSLNHFQVPEAGHESGTSKDRTAQTEMTGYNANETQDTNNNAQEQHDSRFSQVVQETGIDEKLLADLINLPDDKGEEEEGIPSINTYHFGEGIEILGSYRNQRQAQASAILLYIWDVCLDEKKVKFDQLDEGLTASDVETERRKNMYSAFSGDAGDWFESGDGFIWVLGSGKKHVRNLLEELAEQMQN